MGRNINAELIRQVKNAGHYLIDKAEEMVGASPLTDLEITIGFDEDASPMIEIRRDVPVFYWDENKGGWIFYGDSDKESGDSGESM